MFSVELESEEWSCIAIRFDSIWSIEYSNAFTWADINTLDFLFFPFPFLLQCAILFLFSRDQFWPDWYNRQPHFVFASNQKQYQHNIHRPLANTDCLGSAEQDQILQLIHYSYCSEFDPPNPSVSCVVLNSWSEQPSRLIIKARVRIHCIRKMHSIAWRDDGTWINEMRRWQWPRTILITNPFLADNINTCWENVTAPNIIEFR